MRRRGLLVGLVFLGLGCGEGVEPLPPKPFARLGPAGLVGWVHALAFDPSQPGVVYAGSDDTMGLYRSEDGGRTWSPLPAYGAESAWALDVDAEGRIYAGDLYGTGIRVSTDGGQTFTDALGLDLPFISSIDAHPTAPGVAFASAGIDRQADGRAGTGAPLNQQGALYKTTDGGLTWQKLAGGLDTGGSYDRVFIHPGDPDLLFAGRPLDVWRSEDGGDTWVQILAPEPIPGGLRGTGATAFAAPSQDPNTVMFTSVEVELGAEVNVRFGVQVSNDGGLTFAPAETPPASAFFFFSIVASPTGDDFFAFGKLDGATPGDVEGGPSVIASRGNGGLLWEPVPVPSPTAFFTGAIDPSDGALLASSLGDGIFRQDPATGEFALSSSGLGGVLCDDVAVLPGESPRWLVACGNLSFAPLLAASDDLGATWRRVPVPGLDFTRIGDELIVPLAADAASGEVIVGGSGLRRSRDRGDTFEDVPLPGATAVLSFDITQGGDGAFYASALQFLEDGGFATEVLRLVPGEVSPSALAAAPCFVDFLEADPENPRGLYAGCSDLATNSLLHTADGSAWEVLDDPRESLRARDLLLRERVTAIHADPLTPGNLAALSAVSQDGDNFQDPATPEDDRSYGGHVYVSTNGGRRWRAVELPLQRDAAGSFCETPTALLYLSDLPGHLVVGTYSGDVTCPDVDGTVLESFDNGETWRDAGRDQGLSPSNVWLNGLIEDPTTPGALFVTTWYDALFLRAPL